MAFQNTRTTYGWAAIVLHWVSAIGMTALYLLGERIEEASSRAEKLAAQNLHVSVAMLLITFLAARVFWSLSQRRPVPLEPNRAFRLLARTVQGLFLAMIVVLLVTGPLAVWSAARPILILDGISLASPFTAPAPWLHELAEEIHGLAANLFWPLIALHVGGALKHLLFDRDTTMRRMLWVKS